MSLPYDPEVYANPEMKTILLWCPKRCRTPKQVGLATARGSALTIFDYSKLAARGDGRFYIIDAKNAKIARSIIKIYWQHAKTPEKFIVPILNYNDRVIAVGPNAVNALRGAGRSVSQWDERIAKQGAVTWGQSRALGGPDMPLEPYAPQ